MFPPLFIQFDAWRGLYSTDSSLYKQGCSFSRGVSSQCMAVHLLSLFLLFCLIFYYIIKAHAVSLGCCSRSPFPLLFFSLSPRLIVGTRETIRLRQLDTFCFLL